MFIKMNPKSYSDGELQFNFDGHGISDFCLLNPNLNAYLGRDMNSPKSYYNFTGVKYKSYFAVGYDKNFNPEYAYYDNYSTLVIFDKDDQNRIIRRRSYKADNGTIASKSITNFRYTKDKVIIQEGDNNAVNHYYTSPLERVNNIRTFFSPYNCKQYVLCLLYFVKDAETYEFEEISIKRINSDKEYILRIQKFNNAIRVSYSKDKKENIYIDFYNIGDNSVGIDMKSFNCSFDKSIFFGNEGFQISEYFLFHLIEFIDNIISIESYFYVRTFLKDFNVPITFFNDLLNQYEINIHQEDDRESSKFDPENLAHYKKWFGNANERFALMNDGKFGNKHWFSGYGYVINKPRDSAINRAIDIQNKKDKEKEKERIRIKEINRLRKEIEGLIPWKKFGYDSCPLDTTHRYMREYKIKPILKELYLRASKYSVEYETYQIDIIKYFDSDIVQIDFVKYLLDNDCCSEYAYKYYIKNLCKYGVNYFGLKDKMIKGGKEVAISILKNKLHIKAEDINEIYNYFINHQITGIELNIHINNSSFGIKKSKDVSNKPKPKKKRSIRIQQTPINWNDRSGFTSVIEDQELFGNDPDWNLDLNIVEEDECQDAIPDINDPEIFAYDPFINNTLYGMSDEDYIREIERSISNGKNPYLHQ